VTEQACDSEDSNGRHEEDPFFTHGGYRSPSDSRVARDDLLDVLGMDVLTCDDGQIFLPSDDIQLTVDGEPHVAGPVPAVAECLCGEILSVVIAREQRIAPDQNLAEKPSPPQG
jgi:hypothetical protein